MHTNSKLLFAKYARACFDSAIRVLEIGPNGSPSTYRQMVPYRTGVQWDTLDIDDRPHWTYSNSPPYDFPIPDDTYDIVLSGQVIEHVAKIWRWMPELARVTIHGGLVIIINPTSWPYHESPIDCWRIYPEGMKALCEDAGLTVEISLCESLELPNFGESIPDSDHRKRWFKKTIHSGSKPCWRWDEDEFREVRA